MQGSQAGTRRVELRDGHHRWQPTLALTGAVSASLGAMFDDGPGGGRRVEGSYRFVPFEHLDGVDSAGLATAKFFSWCTCVCASARQSRAQCRAREFTSKLLFCVPTVSCEAF